MSILASILPVFIGRLIVFLSFLNVIVIIDHFKLTFDIGFVLVVVIVVVLDCLVFLVVILLIVVLLNRFSRVHPVHLHLSLVLLPAACVAASMVSARVSLVAPVVASSRVICDVAIRVGVGNAVLPVRRVFVEVGLAVRVIWLAVWPDG